MKKLVAFAALFAFGSCAEPTDHSDLISQSAHIDPELLANIHEVPDGFDFEGTWVVRPGQIVSEYKNDGSACEYYTSRENRLMDGRDTMVLKKGEITLDADGSIVVPYTGSYSHWEGYGNGLPDGVTYGCLTQNIEYTLDGELRIDLTTGQGSFGVQGIANNSVPYNYPQEVGIFPANVGDPIFGETEMFVPNDLDTIKLNVGFADYAGNTDIPDGCDFELQDLQFDSRIVTANCTGSAFRTWRFKRVAGLPDINPRGPIKGTIQELTPDGLTNTGRPVEESTIDVYRQKRRVRAKLGAETDQEYLEFLTQARKEMIFAGTVKMKVGDEGKFEIPNLSGFSRDPGQARTYRAAEYMLDITKARSREVLPNAPNDYLNFESKQIYNLRIGADQLIGLRPFDALGRKIGIASQLQSKARFRWGPIETNVLTYLEGLQDGTIPMTPEANEAVRRAVWSEIAARDALHFADPLLTLILDGLASLVTDMVPDIDFNLRRISQGQKRLRDFSPEAARGQSGLDVLRSAKIEQYHREMRARTVGLRLGKGDEETAKAIKATVKAVLFNPIKTNAASLGFDAALVGTVVDAVASAFNAIIDLKLTGQFGGYVKDAIKKRIGDFVKARKNGLLDSASNVTPSFTRFSEAGLTLTETQIGGWGVDDQIAYRADRTAAVTEITAMNAAATDILSESQIRKGLAEGAAASEDAFAVLKAIPAFATAEKAAKIVKILQNASLFIFPTIFVFFDLPNYVTRASYLSWGLPIPSNAMVVYDQNTIRNKRLTDEYEAALDAYIAGIDAFGAALLSGDDEGLFDIYFGSDSTPEISVLRNDLVFARDRVIDELGAWDGEAAIGRSFAPVVTDSIREVSSADAFLLEMNRYLIDIATGAFPDDGAWYQMRRTALSGMIGRLDLEDMRRLARQVGTEPAFDARFAPLVRTEEIHIVDEDGREFLDPSGSRTLTITANIANLSIVDVDDVAARLVVSADTGTVSLNSAEVLSVAASLPSYDGSQNTAAVTWTATYEPGELDDTIVVRVEPVDSGPTGFGFVTSDSIAIFGPDPSTIDEDLDGLPDPWERRYGLDTDADDWDEDPDSDGVTNGVELAAGLAPDNRDTDGDGRSDGDELYGGTIGVTSDPLVTDTDEDGEPDDTDLSPLDETTTLEDTTFEEPCVAVDVETVVLTADEPVVILNVSNACDGELQWGTRVEDPSIVKTLLGRDAQSEGSLVVTSPLRIDPGLQMPTPPSTVLTVFDVSGRRPDSVDVVVTLGTASVQPGDDMGSGDGDPADVGAADGGTTPDIPTNPDGGCCRTIPNRKSHWSLILLAMAAAAQFLNRTGRRSRA